MPRGRFPRAFELPALGLYLVFAFLAAAVCTQINVRLGVTPNTSVVGVVAAIALGRSILTKFRDLDRQNFLQTATSAGGFAAANIALVAVSVLHLVGLGHLILPLLLGVALGMAADIYLAYRLFDSPAFPAAAAWPDGVATGQVILSGDEGGEKGRRLLQGIGAGIGGSLLSLPMAGIGIAFIGNPISLAALGAGLVLRGYGSAWFEGSYFPHGFMIGAGLVQAAQTLRLVVGRARGMRGREVLVHLLSFLLGALVLCLVARPAGTSAAGVVVWLAYAALAAFVHTLIVGYCAMLTGWFPSFAVAIALVLVAVLFRFPLPLLALLSGYILSTGPLFADLGYDLKAGWIVRGAGRDRERETSGRRQQFLLQELGGLTGIVFVALFYRSYFQLGLIPPMGKVLAATISLQISPALLQEVLLAATAGAALQVAGGSSRALGILFATGLLLVNPLYGIALLLAVAARLAVGDAFMEIRAPGLIAGDGLASFVQAARLALP
jgi:uncharacterized oligopeptide transporter (OPT) family protein